MKDYEPNIHGKAVVADKNSCSFTKLFYGVVDNGGWTFLNVSSSISISSNDSIICDV